MAAITIWRPDEEPVIEGDPILVDGGRDFPAAGLALASCLEVVELLPGRAGRMARMLTIQSGMVLGTIHDFYTSVRAATDSHFQL